VNLTDWARANDVNTHTAYRWFKEGTPPVPAVRINSRSILVQVPSSVLATPARPLRPGLLAQQEGRPRPDWRFEAYAGAHDFEVVDRVGEVGSGMNGHRTKLRRLPGDAGVGVIVVEHRERLGRMNTERVEAPLGAQPRRGPNHQGRHIVVVDDQEMDDDLVHDMTEVLTWFCARLYGRRGARNRASRATAHAELAP
jgi:putative resolvase